MSAMKSEHQGERQLAEGRSIAIAVDLSDESAHAVRWAVDNYLRPADQVGLICRARLQNL